MSTLDYDEHFYLALNAISEKSHERAILHLKEIVEGEYFFKAQYLLAAEYAEIGMYDKAKQYFDAVVDVESLGQVALLQKGLLHVFLAEKSAAHECFKRIVYSSGEEHYLFWFSKGMLNSLEDNNHEAIECLKKGIDLNTVNEPLNQDMRNYIDVISNRLSGNASAVLADATDAIKKPSSQGSNKFLLTNYRDDAL